MLAYSWFGHVFFNRVSLPTVSILLCLSQLTDMFHFHVHKAAIEPHSRRNWFVLLTLYYQFKIRFVAPLFSRCPMVCQNCSEADGKSFRRPLQTHMLEFLFQPPPGLHFAWPADTCQLLLRGYPSARGFPAHPMFRCAKPVLHPPLPCPPFLTKEVMLYVSIAGIGPSVPFL